MIRSGKLTCPKCGRNKINGWTEWQNKGDKWIFYWKGEWCGTNYSVAWWHTFQGPKSENSSECWEKSGSTIEQWNNWNKGNNLWKCDFCGFRSDTCLDFTQLGGGKHICPYGCGRMIPDQYHGCSELLRDCPNYVF